MKRTKQPAGKTNPKKQQQTMTRTKPPQKKKQGGTNNPQYQTTADGRILGEPYEYYIPEHFRAILPDHEERIRKAHKSREQKQKAMLKAMVRRLAPLSTSEDGEVLDARKGTTFRMNGLNQARFNALIGSMYKGATIKQACRAAGIHPVTYHEWVRKGENGVYPYTYIYAAIKEAEANMEVLLMESILKAGFMHEDYVETTRERNIVTGELQVSKEVMKRLARKWQALAWLLERRNPELRLTHTEDPQQTGNNDEDDLLIMDGISTGMVQEYNQED